MKQIAFMLIIALGAMQAAQAADDPGCDARATEKHLSGAARNSFIKKCEKTVQADQAKQQCAAQADEKKLHGAARNSFVKKCVSTAGSAK